MLSTSQPRMRMQESPSPNSLAQPLLRDAPPRPVHVGANLSLRAGRGNGGGAGLRTRRRVRRDPPPTPPLACAWYEVLCATRRRLESVGTPASLVVGGCTWALLLPVPVGVKKKTSVRTGYPLTLVPCWSTEIYVKLGGTFQNSRLSEHSFLLCFVVCTAVHLETPIGVRGHPVCARALPARHKSVVRSEASQHTTVSRRD